VRPRSFEWFGFYRLNNPQPISGYPTEWSQFGQGQSGTIFVDPLPDIPYTCPIDMVAAPENLVDDTTPEAIPVLWQFAVPFFAAWLAFQNLLRQADAQEMLKNYETMMARARAGANSSQLPGTYAQAPDPMENNRLGTQPQQRGGAAA
jgi:hypothetical protein